MELWLIAQGPIGRATHVAIDSPPGRMIGDVVEALARFLRTPSGPSDQPLALYSERLRTWLPNDQPLRSSGLRQGDRVAVAPRAKALMPSKDPVFELVVRGGPLAGLRADLPEGRTTVGRAATNDIRLDDPSVSGSHFVVRVERNVAFVTDSGSKNGIVVAGAQVASGAEQPVDVGEPFQAGRVQLRIEPPTVARELADEDEGWVRFNRPPRRTEPFAPVHIRVSAPPPDPQPARLPLIAAVVPLIGGLALWLLTKNPATLLFAALSPVMAVTSAIEDSRRGKRGFHRGAEAYRAKLIAAREDVERAREKETSVRSDASPDPTELLGRAEALSTRIWERRTTDRDFLELRVGLATQASSIEVELEPGGNESLRAEAGGLLQEASEVPNVPVTFSLKAGVVGLVGPEAAVLNLARWLVMQAALLHSPRELTILGALRDSADEEWAWLKWLPHTRPSVRDEWRLTAGTKHARVLLSALDRAVEQRRAREAVGSTPREYVPATLLVVHEDVIPDRALVARLFADGPQRGVTAIWIGRSNEDVPGECRAVIDLAEDGSTLTLTDLVRDQTIRNVKPDGLAMRTARTGAQAVASLSDTGAQDRAAEIPDRVSLFETLQIREVRPNNLIERWRETRSGLAAPIGMTAEGPFSIDLRSDGPHGLVAGTSGSGKSELLRSLVASLAATFPPDRLSFLLVDYKGGAAFSECAGLPHTAGLVTDLDESLAERALESLRAELRRREGVLRDHGASNLRELEQVDPRAAPPNLVIVVDEFATLVSEIPRFVDGIVDIAQRGRSLGLHLLLATQRPRGSINPTILANTNLRIALRVTDPSESADVLDAPDAAYIPRTLAGRAIARTEQGSLTQFQSAYSGAATAMAEAESTEVQVWQLGFGGPLRSALQDGLAPATATQLAQLVEAATTAVEASGIVRPSPPWLPPLAEEISLADARLAASGAGPGAAVIGLLDQPTEQRQPACLIDVAGDGGLLVFGAGGAGKTTLLRTLTLDLASRRSPEQLHVYGLDFDTYELGALSALPHCGGVVTGDEPERVLRLFAILDRLVGERRRAGASADDAMVLLLLDGYSGFSAAFEKVAGGEPIDTFQRLVADGRAFGVYAVITADRRAAIPASLTGRIQRRLVLRMADTDEYAALGVAARRVRDNPPPGRGYVDGVEAQVAFAGSNPSPAAQVEALADLGDAARRSSAAVAPQVTVLPEFVARAELPVAEGLTVPWAIREADMQPLSLGLEHGHFLVVGPRRGGRTTALVTAVHGLLNQTRPPRIVVLAPRRSLLTDVPGVNVVARGHAECEQVAAGLASEMEVMPSSSEPLVIVIDDGDELAEGAAADAILTLVRRGRDRRVRVLAAAERAAAHRSFGSWLREIRSDGAGLVLRPDLDVDGELFGIRLPRGFRRSFPPGRGYVVDAGAAELVQIAG